MSATESRPGRRFRGVVALAAMAACADWPASIPEGPQGVQPRATLDPGPYVAGDSFFGRNGYVVYYPGNSPMIFAAPHGGMLRPEEIPPRTAETCGADDIVTLADLYTREMAMEIRAAFHTRTGRYPHVIVNRVHRARVEPNRDLAAGACGDPQADTAWNEYHAFLDTARAHVTADHGRGWFTDLHGHAHDIKRLELGYMLAGSALRLSDTALDGSATYENASSFRTFSQGTTASFSRVLRGPASLGTLLAAEGHRAVPSASEPHPLVSEPYFNGGYSVALHTCSTHSLSTGTSICGVQIEHDSTVKVPTSARLDYVNDLLRAYETFLAQNFGFNMATGAYDVMVDNDNLNNDTTRARFTGAGSWTSASASTQKHLNSYLLSDGASSTDEGAFLFYIPLSGTYKIYAWWPSATGHTASATYSIAEVAGGTVLASETVNQQSGGGQWNLLATLSFGQAGWRKVVVPRYGADSGTVAADAIRVVRQP